MKIYVAGVSSDEQFVKSLRSFYEIETDPGDRKQEKVSGRGDVSRRLVCDDFLEGDWDAIAMFDLDMLHPPDILKRLRKHNLDMVTGHYYARNGRNIHSVCWVDADGKWPFVPLVDIPRTGLHPIAVTGMGCVLIQRYVVEAVAKHLPKGDHPFAIGPAPDITGDYSSLGSDHRFFGYAHKLGYRLWLDADIESKHAITMWVGHNIADKLYNPAKTKDRLEAISTEIGRISGMDKKFLQTRLETHKKQLEDFVNQREQAAQKVNFMERQILALRAVMSEEEYLISQMDGPFPVVMESDRQVILDTRTGVGDGMSEKDAKFARETVLRKEAAGWVDDIQTIRGSGVLQEPA